MFKIIIDGHKPIIVKPVNKVKEIDSNDDLESKFLKDLGLEKVDLQDILPKSKRLVNNNDLEITNDICGICREEYKLNEYIRKLNCNHIFHKKCIDKWFKNNSNCPNCRHDLI